LFESLSVCVYFRLYGGLSIAISEFRGELFVSFVAMKEG